MFHVPCPDAEIGKTTGILEEAKQKKNREKTRADAGRSRKHLPFRLEERVVRGKTQYSLVKDFKINGKKFKASKYVGAARPGAGELRRLQAQYFSELVMKVVRKKTDESVKKYRVHFLEPQDLRVVEELKHLNRVFEELLTISEEQYYQEKFETDYVQGTTAIEGNTLDRRQVYDLLHNNVHPTGKRLREINEVQNFLSVKAYRDAYRGRVTTAFIKGLHARIMANIDNESAGRFRRRGVSIAGTDVWVTPPPLIEGELEAVIREYYANLREGGNPFEAASVFHMKFETVHPFTDGNGRVGREVFNCMLSRKKYPRLLFTGKDRPAYIDALSEGQHGRCREMIQGFIRLIEEQRRELYRDVEQLLAAEAKDI